MVMNVLHLASEASANPDLRDRGYIYWRMLSTDPTRTKDVVLAKRPEVEEDLTKLMDDKTREIFQDIFISKATHSALKPEKTATPDDDSDSDKEEVEVEAKKPKKSKKKDKKDKKEKKKSKEDKKEEIQLDEEVVEEPPKEEQDLDDIFGLGLGDTPAPDQAPTDAIPGGLEDIFGGSNGNANQPAMAEVWGNDNLFGEQFSASEAGIFIKPQHSEVLSSATLGSQNKASGLQIKGRFYREAGAIKLDLIFYNSSQGIISDFEIMFNKNSFGLKPEGINVIPITSGQTFTTTVNCVIDPGNADTKNPPGCPYYVQTAIKSSIDIFYFQIP